MFRTALACAAIALAACTPEAGEPDEFQPVPIAPFMGETVLGNLNAPVEIIEYASTTCIHCKAFHEQVLPELKTAYIDTGKARLVYRVLPTQPAAIAMAGPAIARCAGETEFFNVLTDLFASQEELVTAGSEAAARAVLARLGARHGLNEAEVRTCIDSPEIAALIIQGVQDSPDFVTATPSLIVGGKPVEDYSFPSLSTAIEAELAAGATPL